MYFVTFHEIDNFYNCFQFFNLMTKFYVAKNTSMKDFKRQIIEEAKIPEVNCVLELDK